MYKRHSWHQLYNTEPNPNATVETVRGKVSIKQLLLEIHKMYPKGFKSSEANKYLEQRYDIHTFEGEFFRKLAKEGHLKKENYNNNDGPGGRRNLYHLNEELLLGENIDSIEIPPVLYSYSTSSWTGLLNLDSKLYLPSGTIQVIDTLQALKDSPHMLGAKKFRAENGNYTLFREFGIHLKGGQYYEKLHKLHYLNKHTQKFEHHKTISLFEVKEEILSKYENVLVEKLFRTEKNFYHMLKLYLDTNQQDEIPWGKFELIRTMSQYEPLKEKINLASEELRKDFPELEKVLKK